jgi:hypothetical protein
VASGNQEYYRKIRNRRPRTDYRLIGVTFAYGLVAGVAVGVVAFLLARYGPAGDGWSFRGNGALAAFTLVPVLLTGGWTALALLARSHPDWLGLALGAALVSFLLALADAILLPLFGSDADRVLGPILLLSLLIWSVAAPIVALRIASPRQADSRPSVRSYLAAAVVLLVAINIGLVVSQMVIPAGS